MLGILITPSEFSSVNENRNNFWPSCQNINTKGTDTYCSEQFAAAVKLLGDKWWQTLNSKSSWQFLSHSDYCLEHVQLLLLWSYQSGSSQIQLFEKYCTFSSQENLFFHLFKILWESASGPHLSNAFMSLNVPVFSVFLSRLILSFRYRCVFVPEMFVSFTYYII
jgi:hypothetical protein